MWDRAILKSNAKLALKGRYWTAFGVCILAVIIGGAFSIVTTPYNLSYRDALSGAARSMELLAAQSGMMNLISIGNILFDVFITLPIAIGMSRFFLHNHFGVTDLNTLFSGFRRNYLNGVGAMFVTELFIFLWSLLLVIPGLVKALEYSMVPFILADNPDIPGSRARQISRIMTNGEKGAIFVLILSFLGWFILGSICFGVGLLFVIPYYQATITELYIYLRDRAIQTNQINPAELGLISPAPYNPQV